MIELPIDIQTEIINALLAAHWPSIGPLMATCRALNGHIRVLLSAKGAQSRFIRLYNGIVSANEKIRLFYGAYIITNDHELMKIMANSIPILPTMAPRWAKLRASVYGYLDNLSCADIQHTLCTKIYELSCPVAIINAIICVSLTIFEADIVDKGYTLGFNRFFIHIKTAQGGRDDIAINHTVLMRCYIINLKATIGKIADSRPIFTKYISHVDL
jgi:hypothetical protein